MSPGYLSFDGRNETVEGIDIPFALSYYSRFRFVANLLPLLNASPSPRVISILAGGREVELNFDDLEMKNNFNGFSAAGSSATLTSLSFLALAKSNPKITFIHKFPGYVDTGIIDRLFGTASGLWAIPGTIARWILVPIISLFSTSADVVGERGLFVATSERFVQPGVYLLNEMDEVAPDVPVMGKYRSDGSDDKVWEDTQKVWERAEAKAAAAN